MKRNGTPFAKESKVMCLFDLILRSGVLMFRISNINKCVKNFLRLRKVEVPSYRASLMKTFLEDLSVRSRNEQVMLRTSKIMPVNGINTVEFVRQVFEY